MMIEVIPISRTSVDLKNFLLVAKQVLGYDIGRPADSSKTTLSENAKFLGAISCLHDEGLLQKPINHILQKSASICSHLSYTFAVIASSEVIFKSMELSGLKHTVGEGRKSMQLVLISGTLQEWKTATLECCTQDVDMDLRLLYDKILLCLEEEGFRELWSDTRKKSHTDKTFYLESK